MITLTRLKAPAPECTGGIMTIGFVVTIDTADSMAAFSQMVNRGVQTWTDAPTEIKEFADEVISGKHMQNYRFLANQPPKGEKK